MVYGKIFLYTLENTIRRNMGEFMDFFWELPHNVQALIIEELHENTKTWCIQHKLLIIDAYKLTKYRQ